MLLQQGNFSGLVPLPALVRLDAQCIWRRTTRLLELLIEVELSNPGGRGYRTARQLAHMNELIK